MNCRPIIFTFVFLFIKNAVLIFFKKEPLRVSRFIFTEGIRDNKPFKGINNSERK